MAIVGCLCQNSDTTAYFFDKFCCGIHIEKHWHIRMTHLLHVLASHHGHAAFAYSVENNLNITKLCEHPQKSNNLAFLKIVE